MGTLNGYFGNATPWLVCPNPQNQALFRKRISNPSCQFAGRATSFTSHRTIGVLWPLIKDISLC